MIKYNWSPGLIAQSVADLTRGSFHVYDAAPVFLALAVLKHAPRRRGVKLSWPTPTDLKDGADKWFLRAWAELEEARSLLKGIASELRWSAPTALSRHETELCQILGRLARPEVQDILSDPDACDRIFHSLVATGPQVQAGPVDAPAEVAEIVAAVAKPQEGITVCDPACGLGSFLVACVREVRKKGGDATTLRLFGQDRNARACAIARMRCALAGVWDAVVVCGDTLTDPRFTQDRSIQQFDLVISNPPFGAMWEPQATADPFGRFAWAVPPRSRADSAFLLHSIASIASTGRAVIVTSQGVLFRSGADEEIRRHLVEEDLIEAIIGLPEGTFAKTSIATTILVLNRAKDRKARDRVLFVDVPLGEADRSRRRKLDTTAAARIRAAAGGESGDGVRSVARSDLDVSSLALTRYVAPRQREESASDLAHLVELVAKHEEARHVAEVEMDSLLRELSDGQSKLREVMERRRREAPWGKQR
jgi:type I restriction enzyme M protein